MKKAIKIVAVICLIAFFTVFIGYQSKILDNLIFNGEQMDMVKLFNDYKLGQLEKRIQIVVEQLIDAQNREVQNVENISQLERNISKLNKILEETKESLERDYERIDDKDIERLVGATVLIINRTKGYLGSGVHIKIINKHYILSCSHLVIGLNDRLVVRKLDGKDYPIFLLKIDTVNDLSLFRIDVTELSNLPYAVISDVSPTQGSKITIVGNPAGQTNIVTTGAIAKIFARAYLFTNKIFSGNSGGPVFYKGKVVGIATQIRILSNRTYIFVNYGYGPNLDAIKIFLWEYM